MAFFSTSKQKLPEVFVKMVDVNKDIAAAKHVEGNVVHVHGFPQLYALKREKGYIRHECETFIRNQRGGNTA